ncbi:hypothetical protein AB0D08_40195 [Kitasatospora sp. NPDC048540]|uniref:hypothetical protein n=1 Tax=Kitasatospora sp. NPDC048540 TaxID=3155634 RepID=UPI0033C64FBB
MKPEDDDRLSGPEARGSAVHPGLGTPVPDDPELLLGDALAAQDLLGVGPTPPADPPTEDEHSLLERARESVGRVTAAAVHAGDAGLGRVRQAAEWAAERARYGEPATAYQDWTETGRPVRRSPYLLGAGLTAGVLIVWAVLRRRR